MLSPLLSLLLFSTISSTFLTHTHTCIHTYTHIYNLLKKYLRIHYYLCTWCVCVVCGLLFYFLSLFFPFSIIIYHMPLPIERYTKNCLPTAATAQKNALLTLYLFLVHAFSLSHPPSLPFLASRIFYYLPFPPYIFLYLYCCFLHKYIMDLRWCTYAFQRDYGERKNLECWCALPLPLL